ncbi:hypothetical protein D5085_01625 [Ectothiorhodospiraceae bacterium BW-2]|nr:hypothetical protein D5085_01625 [Ectothiorhodospiraceae bacterium BW-2]
MQQQREHYLSNIQRVNDDPTQQQPIDNQCHNSEISSLLCEAMQVLERHQMLIYTSPQLQKWWQEHKMRDREKECLEVEIEVEAAKSEEANNRSILTHKK